MTLDQLERKYPELKGFKKRYQTELLPLLRVNERLRSSGNYILTFGIVLGVIGGLALQASEGSDSGLLLGIGIALVVPAVVLSLWGGKRVSQAKSDAKRSLTKHLTQLLGVSFQETLALAQLGTFEDLDLLPSYDESDVEDEVRGKVDELPFVIQEAKLVRKKSSFGSGSSGLRIAVSFANKGEDETVFHGLLCKVKFHKDFRSTTIARADKGVLNRVADVFVPGDRVRLESPQFEKLYEVYSSDQVEARYILTPAFMERMVDFHKRFQGKLQFAFDKGHLFVSIDKQPKWMEAPGQLSDETYIARMVEDLTLGHQLIAALKLDAGTKA